MYLSEGECRMTPEQKARETIDKKLEQSGWIVQDSELQNYFNSLESGLQNSLSSRYHSFAKDGHAA